VFEVGSLAELGVTPILVERLTGGQVGAGVLGLAGTQATTAGCQPATSAPVALLGMATSEGEQSTIVLANPFAVEATARLVGASEFGPDTVTELETVRVPANSTLTLPLSQSMAGRQQLGFTVYTDVGAVVAGMARSGPDIASSEAITGAQQWFVPLPAFGVSGHLIVHNLAAVDANYRLDAVNPDGVTEEVENGALVPDAEIWLSLEDLGASGGYVVTADEPVAVAVVYTGDVTRVVSTASPASTVAWLVPISSDAAGLDTAVWILNPDEAAITAEIAVFGGRSVEVSLPAGTTTGRSSTGTRVSRARSPAVSAPASVPVAARLAVAPSAATTRSGAPAKSMSYRTAIAAVSTASNARSSTAMAAALPRKIPPGSRHERRSPSRAPLAASTADARDTARRVASSTATQNKPGATRPS